MGDTKTRAMAQQGESDKAMADPWKWNEKG
jgi:hypothetical protein